MAFLFQAPKSPYWIAGFNDSTGKRRNRSTKIPYRGTSTERAENREKAQGIAKDLEAASKGLKTSIQIRQTMADLHEQATGEKIELLSTREAIKRWLKSKDDLEASSLGTYKSHVNRFLRFLGERADWEPLRIKENDIEEFRDDSASQISRTATNNALKSVKTIFRYMVAKKFITESPAEFVKTISLKAEKDAGNQPVKKESFTEEQVLKIYDVCPDDEWRSAVLWAYSTGQRLGDIARIRWCDVSLNGRGAFNFTSQKTGRQMHIPLHTSLLKSLKNLPRPISDELPIHPSLHACIPTEGERKGSTSDLSAIFARILVKAGLRENRPHEALANGRNGRRTLNPLTFHSFRKTASTLLALAEVPRAVAQEIVGHDSAEVHDAYVRVGEKALRDGIEKIPDLLAGR